MFCFLKSSLPSILFTARLPYRCDGVPGKKCKIVRSGLLLVPDVGVNVKLLEFKSHLVILLQYLAKMDTKSKYNMNHICMIKLVVLNRPSFQSRKYGVLTFK